jgi:single-strand DNA-binding protein
MNTITIVGNVGKPVELKFSQGGMAVGTFTVATTSGKDDKKVTVWHNVTVFGQMAEHTASSLEKGSRVIVVGKLDISSYEKDGQKKYTTKILADEIGLTCRFNPVMADKTTQVVAKAQKDFGNIGFLEQEEAF